jgi:ribosome-binding factor A
MANRRQIQVADEIQRIISHLLERELKDPRFGFATITKVEVTSDLRYARVYVSVFGTPEEQKDTMRAFESSKGFIRRELAARMNIRFVPELQFKLDPSIEYGDRISRLLQELKQEESRRTEAGTEAGTGLEAETGANPSGMSGVQQPQAQEGQPD